MTPWRDGFVAMAWHGLGVFFIFYFLLCLAIPTASRLGMEPAPQQLPEPQQRHCQTHTHTHTHTLIKMVYKGSLLQNWCIQREQDRSLKQVWGVLREQEKETHLECIVLNYWGWDEGFLGWGVDCRVWISSWYWRSEHLIFLIRLSQWGKILNARQKIEGKYSQKIYH